MNYTPGLPHPYARGLHCVKPEPHRFVAVS